MASPARSESYESRKLIDAAATSQIMNKKYVKRDRVKHEMLEQQANFRTKKFQQKQKKTMEWQAKTQRSPFLVDLLAENER